jgi:hypothetical protein
MKIVKAKLIKRETDDKMMQVNSTVPDNAEYLVDLDEKKEYSFLNTEHNVTHKKEMVKDIRGGFLPVELL